MGMDRRLLTSWEVNLALRFSSAFSRFRRATPPRLARSPSKAPTQRVPTSTTDNGISRDPK